MYRINLLHMELMLPIIKVFVILLLLCLREQETPWQFSKEIGKLSFQLTVQIYSRLGQNEGERKVFFGEGGPHCSIILKSTWLS